MTILGALPYSVAPAGSPRWLLVTPHRLLFFIGTSNLLLAMLWWAIWLLAHCWTALGLAMPNVAAHVPAGWLHAFIMQYQVLPSFMFGFLLTVFPRWMGLPELARCRYVPVGIRLIGGHGFCLLAAAFGWRYCLDKKPGTSSAPSEAGALQEVKVLYLEGVASHRGIESWIEVGND